MRRSVGLPFTLRGSPTDAIPGYLVWSGLLLSIGAVLFGFFFTDVWTTPVHDGWNDNAVGFVSNVLASLALVGPGVFITSRVVRQWQQRKLVPYAQQVSEHLQRILKGIADDCGLSSVTQPGDEPKDFTTLREEAGKVAKDLGHLHTGAADDLNLDLDRPAVTLRREVELLESYLGGLFTLTGAVTGPVWVQAIAEAAATWDELHGHPALAKDVYAAGQDLASKLARLVEALQKPDLPLLR